MNIVADIILKHRIHWFWPIASRAENCSWLNYFGVRRDANILHLISIKWVLSNSTALKILRIRGYRSWSCIHLLMGNFLRIVVVLDVGNSVLKRIVRRSIIFGGWRLGRSDKSLQKTSVINVLHYFHYILTISSSSEMQGKLFGAGLRIHIVYIK